MKNLIIVRHAKSSWENYSSDKARILTEKGKIDASLVAINLGNFLNFNYIIYSSTANRARETATIFATNFSYPVHEIIFLEDLYTFDENQLEKVIKSLNNDKQNGILFGHNDAITNFVNKFGDIFIENIPTSGLVWMQFDCDDWKLLKKGKIHKVIFPRDLKI